MVVLEDIYSSNSTRVDINIDIQEKHMKLPRALIS